MSDFIKKSIIELKNKKIPNPYLDLRIILNYSSKSKKEIFLSNFIKNDINLNKFNSLLKRRLKFEPISKIINNKNFWKYNFYVNNKVIDPRPETEIIIEQALKIIKNKKLNLNILDIGTGSGCLSVCLAKEFINSKIISIDSSKEAIKVAKKNFKKYKCEKQISSRICSIESIFEKFDLIVSNPPYLSLNEYKNTMLDIKKYEPKLAFLGGNDGLFFYRKFAYFLPNIMKKNSFLIIEIGENQAVQCLKIFEKTGLKFVKKVKDLQKKDRILIFSKL